MTSPDPEKLKEVLRKAKTKLLLDDLTDQHDAEMVEQRRNHRIEMERVRLEAENRILRDVLAKQSGLGLGVPHDASDGLGEEVAGLGLPGPSVNGLAATEGTSTTSLTLKQVIDKFLTDYPVKKSPEMFKKHKTALALLLDVVGDKPVSALRQADIKDYFDTIQKLPPRWSDLCKKQRVPAKILAEQDHPVLLGPKTFVGTYKASLRPFLAESINSWQDQGFPITLTTDGNNYKGDREPGENKQRPFTAAELKTLFDGPKMQDIAGDAAQAHRYWLPVVGLYTGARVNEICQINPAMDIIQDAKSGIWYFNIDDKSEADVRISKRTKNAGSRRKVPVHAKLIELGFLEYCDWAKRKGAKLLFPAFAPSRRRVSGEAEKWFRGFLRDIEVRDETAGERIVGMHAFRSTLLSTAFNMSPPVDLRSITGHSNGKGAVVNGYEGELSIVNKKKLLDEISFDLDFHRPVSPTRQPTT